MHLTSEEQLQFEEDAAYTEDIAHDVVLEVQVLEIGNFWGDVPRCAAFRKREHVRVNRGCKPEINDLQLVQVALLLEHDIFRLQVPVHDADFVHVGNRG